MQVLAFTDHFGLADDDERVNQYGGAIAMGHPLASSGVRLMTQLARQFAERPDVRYGLTTMCVGLGMGGTVIWENPHFTASTRRKQPTRDRRERPVSTIEKARTATDSADSAPEVVTHALTRLIDVPATNAPAGSRRVALITLDNGRDHTRPNTLGPLGLASLDAAISSRCRRLPRRDRRHRQAVHLRGRRRPVAGRRWSPTGDSAAEIRRARPPGVPPARHARHPDLRLRQRRRLGRRNGARPALRLPDPGIERRRRWPARRSSSASCRAGAAPSCSPGSPDRRTP